MAKDRQTGSVLRAAMMMFVIGLIAAAVPWPDSPDFLLETSLPSFESIYSDSPNFAVDTTLAQGDTHYSDSRDFSLDTTRINRAWGDSEPFAFENPLGCVGEYDGTYHGASSGFVEGYLDCDNTLSFTFISYLGPVQFRSVAAVDPVGHVSGSFSGATMSGTFDFTDCTASGTWVYAGIYSGAWNLTRSARGPCFAPSPDEQPHPDQDLQPGNMVSLDHLWKWDDSAGRFVKPPIGTDIADIIAPDRPTYLLTHGWDGELDGHPCGNLINRDSDPRITCGDLTSLVDKPEFAMSSVAAAIWRAEAGSVNLVAWDWAKEANPNGCCDIRDFLNAPSDVLSVEADKLGRALQTANIPLIIAISRDVSDDLACNSCEVRAHCILRDAYRSGVAALNEGTKLGTQLGEALHHGRSLGSELHFVGKSHGGGVLGQAAKTLNAVFGYTVKSLTTLDTPRTRILGGYQLRMIDSLKYVDPLSVDHAAVFYYPQRFADWEHGRLFGLGAPIQSRAPNLTNLSLNPGNAPEGSINPLGSPTILHWWIAGNDDCECQPPWSRNACLPDDGWFPVNVWNNAGVPPGPETLTFEQDNDLRTTVLDVEHFPHGIWVEHFPRNEFAPTGACCIPALIPLGSNRCEQVSEAECESGGVFLGNGSVCLGGFVDPACNPSAASSAGSLPSETTVPGMSLIRLEPFQSAATWSGNLAQLVIGTDPDDANNRVILMQEQGDASFFKDIDWPEDAVVVAFDYLFREPRGGENLTVYVDDQIVYYDNADTTLAHDHLTSSGAIYVGNVAGRTARLNFVLRTDQPDGSALGGELLIDNIRVYGFLEADADLDGDRDLVDFAAFQRCFGVSPIPDECWVFDVDGADGVGLNDHRAIYEILADDVRGGPHIVPIP